MITPTIRVRALDGTAQDLRALVRDQVTVVLFFSRFCGPAVNALPELQRVALQLAEEGVRMVMVMEETEPSVALNAFLKQHNVAMPVVLDDAKTASQAFNQWGTPNAYVLDAKGRTMLAPTEDSDLLLVRAEAIRLATGLNGRT